MVRGGGRGPEKARKAKRGAGRLCFSGGGGGGGAGGGGKKKKKKKKSSSRRSGNNGGGEQRVGDSMGGD